MKADDQKPAEWLAPWGAAALLRQVAGIQVSVPELVSLCEQGKCQAYANHTPPGRGSVFEPLKPDAVWRNTQRLIFRRADISALAAKMNGGANPAAKTTSTADAIEAHQRALNALQWQRMQEEKSEALLRHLQETNPAAASMLLEARERAELAEQRAADLERQAAELAEGQGGTEELEGLRQQLEQLEQERAARQAAERRAEQAEAEAEGLRQQLCNVKAAYEALRRQERATQDVWAFAQAESTRKGYELAAITEELERLRQLAPTAEHAESPPETPASGLTFPYTTKELEAMRAAVAKYWEGYTPDKRQPTQVEVQLELCELLGLERMKNGDPPRKVKALAGAIKPDTLPDA